MSARDLRKGSAEVLILALLEERDRHGYEIAKLIDRRSDGTLDVEGTQLHLVLRMSNQPDGTATGRLVNLDEGGLEVPLTITQKDSGVALDLAAVGGSYTGTLDPKGTELAGTYTQGQLKAPLIFRRR